MVPEIARSLLLGLVGLCPKTKTSLPTTAARRDQRRRAVVNGECVHGTATDRLRSFNVKVDVGSSNPGALFFRIRSNRDNKHKNATTLTLLHVMKRIAANWTVLSRGSYWRKIE